MPPELVARANTGEEGALDEIVGLASDLAREEPVHLVEMTGKECLSGRPIPRPPLLEKHEIWIHLPTVPWRARADRAITIGLVNHLPFRRCAAERCRASGSRALRQKLQV